MRWWWWGEGMEHSGCSDEGGVVQGRGDEADGLAAHARTGSTAGHVHRHVTAKKKCAGGQHHRHAHSPGSEICSDLVMPDGSRPADCRAGVRYESLGAPVTPYGLPGSRGRTAKSPPPPTCRRQDPLRSVPAHSADLWGGAFRARRCAALLVGTPRGSTTPRSLLVGWRRVRRRSLTQRRSPSSSPEPASPTSRGSRDAPPPLPRVGGALDGCLAMASAQPGTSPPPRYGPSPAPAPRAAAPLRIVPITDVPPEAGFTPRAARAPPPVLVDNAPYSVIHHLVVVGPTGTPLYDLPALAEPRGAVGLPVDPAGRVGLLRAYRPVPAASPAAFAFPTPAAGHHGVQSIEAPRGFPAVAEDAAAAAMREVAEEVGLPLGRVGGVRPLGWVNVNTSVYLSDIPVFAVRVALDGGEGDSGGSRGIAAAAAPAPPDPHESIAGMDWYGHADLTALIASGRLRCGLTLAALAHALAWGPARLAAFGAAAGEGRGEGLHPLDALLLAGGGGGGAACAPRSWLEVLLVEAWERGVGQWPLLRGVEVVLWAAGTAGRRAAEEALAATADAKADGAWVLREPLCYDGLVVDCVCLADGVPAPLSAAVAESTLAGPAGGAGGPTGPGAHPAAEAAPVCELLCAVAEVDAAGFFGACPAQLAWASMPGKGGLPAHVSLRLPSGVLSVRRL